MERQEVEGKVFSHLTAVRPSDRLSKGGRKDYWFFLCDCGTEKEIRLSNVRSGSVISCGCSRAEANLRRRETGLFYREGAEEKKCSQCGLELPLKDFRARTKRYESFSGPRVVQYYQPDCRKCENKRHKSYRQTEHHKEVSQKRKDIARYTIKGHVQDRLSQWKKRTPGSNLTSNYLIDLFHTQGGKCYYSGVPLVVGVRGNPIPATISLDRLDPAKGYMKGNVVWCSYLTNTMKQTMPEQEFYEFLEQILRYRERMM